jgi:hypothetical protein
MIPSAPDIRWQDLLTSLSSQQEPTDPITLTAYNVSLGKEQNDDYAYACDLALNDEDKETIIAFFLSGATVVEISNSLRIPLKVLDVFEKLVIDTSKFRNKLELLRYAEQCKKRFKKVAHIIDLGIVQGPFALIYHFSHGHEELPVNTKEYARTMMQQAFYFGMMSKGNSLKSAVAKESLRWLTTTAGLLKDYDRILGDSHDSDEALLEIEKRKMTVTPEELGIDVDTIIH